MGFEDNGDAALPIVPWGPRAVGFDPNTPDAALPIEPWVSGFVDPYSREALSTQAMPPPQEYYRGAATASETARRAGKGLFDVADTLGAKGILTQGLAAQAGYRPPLTGEDYSGFAQGLAMSSMPGPKAAKIKEPAAAAPAFRPAATASGRTFGIAEPMQGISKVDEAVNLLKRATGVGIEENDIATPIMRERQRVKAVAESQAARLGSIADVTEGQFLSMDRAGRIQGLPGAPTLQDAAARLPQFEPYMTFEQKSAMYRLRDEMAPFYDTLKEQGIEPSSRPDIQPGGFYLPRGRAALEGADAPVKASLKRSTGGKKGFEKSAVFDSMSDGIEAGYEYSKFRDSLQSYAHDAGNRAVDAWAAQSFKNTGLGEGVKERLLRSHPDLVREWQDVNRQIVSVRSKLETAERRAGVAGSSADELDTALSEMSRAQPDGGASPLARIPAALGNLARRADDLQLRPGQTPRNISRGQAMMAAVNKLDALVPDGTERVRFLDTAILRTERRIDLLAGRGGRYSTEAASLRKELDTLNEHYRSVGPEYRNAFERAATAPRDQGSIGFAALNGTTFPDEVANVANKFLDAEKPTSGKLAGVINAASAFNGLMRGLRATADISYTGIQGLLGSVQHPAQYAKAMKVAFQSMGDPAAFGKYVTQFDDIARASGRPTSADWNAIGSRLGGTSTEFQLGGGVKGLGERIQNAPIVKQSNRAFGAFGDTLRLGSNDALYGARQASGKGNTLADMADIAKFSNLMTGWSSRRFLGDAGAVVEFAPRFFQSQLDLLGNALANPLTAKLGGPSASGIVAGESRAAIAKLIGIGSAITFAANAARGKPTDVRPGSPNFMRIRDVGGSDVSLFGPWDSLLRGTLAATQGDFEYMARSKASPLVSLVWDEWSGKSFVGKDTRNPEYLLRSLLPFSLAQVGQSSETLSSGLIGMTGVKATPLSPTDKVEEGQYQSMNAEEQFKGKRHLAWMSVEAQYGPDTKGFDSYYEWYQSKVGEYEKQFESAGATPAVAKQQAQDAFAKHPVAKAYTAIQNQLEDQWALNHPKEALALFKKEQSLPWQDITFRPTKAVRDALLATDTR